MEIIKNEVKNEIISIRNRILDTQNECIREYCNDAPMELKKYVFDIMLSINNKIRAYEFVNEKNYEFDYLTPKLNIDKILKKLQSVAERLRNDYYYELVYSFRAFIKDLKEKEYFKNKKEELNKILSELKLKSYIKSNKEYQKVARLMASISAIDESCDVFSNSRLHNLANLYGIKQILLDYEKYLLSPKEVNDANLRRAIYSLINENISFDFLSVIENKHY